MITISIRPLHLAIVCAFLAGILVAVGIFAFSGGSDSEPEAPTSANIDEAPTPSPSPSPTLTPEPTNEPAPTPTPTEAPEIRSCDEIKADPTYRSPEERTYFLDNCVGGEESAPAGPAASVAPSSNSAEATAAEELYRDRAAANLLVISVKIEQYFNTLGYTPPVSKFLEFGALLRMFAAELDRLPTPPPRFEQVHYQLRSSLLALADHILTVVDVKSEKQGTAWLDTYFELGDAFGAALEDYGLVVGIDLPEIFG